jgi:cobalt-zinc-cadmium efflux system protein
MSDHDQSHDHSRHGHAAHSHAPANFGRAFLIGTVLNMGFVTIEAGYGFVANSVALLADAGHNLSDVLGLLVAWGAATLSQRRPSKHYTYGLRRTSILAALFNAVFLLVAVGAIAYEALNRIAQPQPVEGGIVMAVAAVGIVVNGVTAWLFASGRKGDINIRGAYMHMAADAAVSAGVVVSGFASLQTGWLWLDPVTSLVVVAVILIGTWGLLRDSINMSLDRVPDGIAPSEVEAALVALPGVTIVHDLHIWSMSTTESALTCHLVMPAGCPDDAFLHDTSEMLRANFSIDHSTIQVERDDRDGACAQAAAEAV